jgi:hypothetical protein
MSLKPSIEDLLWMSTGAVALLAVMLVVLHFQNKQNPAAQLASKAQRVELVGRMQLALASAAEAEKSAVLAVTDADSQMFADQVSTATAEVDRERGELSERLTITGTQGEKDLLAQFTEAFAELQQIDKDLLALAVKNTNLKASSLAFGPAAAAVKEMDAALARLPGDDVNILRLADNARIAAWRLLTLIPPHIAEESDAKMDEMETQMADEDRQVRQSLDALATLPVFADNADLKTAAASYARFSEAKAQIFKLSRENTNVRSLSISLNQKRKVTLVCQAALSALQQAISEEPIAGVTYGTPVRTGLPVRPR